VHGNLTIIRAELVDESAWRQGEFALPGGSFRKAGTPSPATINSKPEGK
jgi:hypothetical protein